MALIRLPLVINGVDFSLAVQRLGYQVTYEDRQGENATFLLSGDEYLDVLTSRPVITWPLNMLWADELAALKAAIRSSIYVPVYYFDTDQGEGVIGYFHGTIGTESVGLIDSRGYAFRDGAVLTLRSR